MDLNLIKTYALLNTESGMADLNNINGRTLSSSPQGAHLAVVELHLRPIADRPHHPYPSQEETTRVGTQPIDHKLRIIL